LPVCFKPGVPCQIRSKRNCAPPEAGTGATGYSFESSCFTRRVSLIEHCLVRFGSQACPSRTLPSSPVSKKDGKTINVIVETPKGSRNKFAFDEKRKIFQLKKVLPVGMASPYDFGFVPSTKAEDGDPVDVLVLMDEPAFPGCLLQCRVIGVVEGEEGSKKEKVRNDRIVAVEQANHSSGNVDHIHELGKKFVRELEEFFVNYHALSGKKYRVST
jgi:inorganic pyrophosphatase